MSFSFSLFLSLLTFKNIKIMEIKEVKKLKKELQLTILELVNQFEIKTQTHIESIQLFNIDVTTTFSDEEEFLHQLKIKIEI